ncbi:HAUS augmin-like complex subunit 3 [Tubulanus polymorphus]|uniref:HAUS augmin-like complex subunit 3 n=1 Tax=Tubulanus polymorphus TaxID=672921 RepID=UPI003DA389A6
MNGGHFVETLRRLGYPNADKLNRSAFDWMFESGNMAPFLEWFCTSLDSKNRLSPEKWKRYQALPKTAVLEGQQLIDNLKIRKSDEPNEQQIIEQIEELEQEIEEEDDICSHLVHQSDCQMYVELKFLHQAKLNHRISELDKVVTRRKHQYDRICDEIECSDRMLNSCLQTLEVDVRNISDLYAGKSNSDVTFLYRQSLDKYRLAEQEYMGGLKEFSKRIFANVDVNASTGDVSSLNSTLLLHSDNVQQQVIDNKELNRLYMIYPKSTMNWILSVAELRQLEAQQNFMAKQRRLLFGGHLPYVCDITTLGQIQRDLQTKFISVKNQCCSVIEEKLRGLVLMGAEWQRNKVLAGDCDLKLVKQNEFTSKQTQLIDFLLKHNARVVFMNTALELDHQRHQDTNVLLTDVKRELRQMVENHHSQMSLWKAIKDQTYIFSDEDSGTVDAENQFMHGLFYILVSAEKAKASQLLVTHNDVLAAASNLIERKQNLQKSITIAESIQLQNVNKMEQQLLSVDDMLFNCYTSGGGIPLSPESLQILIHSLETSLSTLEQAMKGIIRNITEKDRRLSLCQYEKTERQLFIYFFNDPNKLEQTINKLKTDLDTLISANRNCKTAPTPKKSFGAFFSPS